MRASCPHSVALWSHFPVHVLIDNKYGYRQRIQCIPAQVAQSLDVHYDDLHLPAIIRSVYGSGPHTPKMVAILRDPVERLHSAFFG